MKRKLIRLTFLTFLCLLWLLENNAFSMGDAEDKDQESLCSPKRKNASISLEDQVVEQENKKQKLEGGEGPVQFSMYTHSHFSGETRDESHIKALYVNEMATIVYEGMEQNCSWSKGIEDNERDDPKSKLIKELYSKAKGSPNYLMANLEIGCWDEEKEEMKWEVKPLCNEEGICEAYCSKPNYYDRTINIDGNKVVIKGGKCLAVEATGSEKKVRIDSEENQKNYPIINCINPKWVSVTDKNFPHTEVAFLNKLYTDDFLLSLLQPLQEKNLRAVIIKLYSWRDICSDCQEALSEFQTYLQEQLKKKFKVEIPVYFVGICNKMWEVNAYYRYEKGEKCTRHHNSSVDDASKWLKKDVAWEDCPFAPYASKKFSYFWKGEFNPYAGEIKQSPQSRKIPMFLRLRVADFQKLKDHLMEYFAESLC